MPAFQLCALEVDGHSEPITIAAVPVPTRLMRFRGRLPAEEVHARLHRCLEAMHRAERSVFLWFSEIHERRLYREALHAGEIGWTKARAIVERRKQKIPLSHGPRIPVGRSRRMLVDADVSHDPPRSRPACHAS